MAGRSHQPFPIYLRELEVRETFRVTPSMHRIVLGGEQLGAFESNGYAVGPFRTPNADDHVKLVIPDPTGATPTPVQVDGTLDWPAGSLARARDYTPRRFDAAAGRLELDFVCHPGGLAAEWATGAQVGDRILVAGPRGTTVLPTDIDWYYLVGDETALPAIARWLEELPAGTPVTAVVSVPTRADEQRLGEHLDLDLQWIHRDRTGPHAVMDAARAGRWLPGQVYAWAAGEASLLRPLRRFLRHEKGVDRRHLDVAGYWRAGRDQYEAALTRMRLRQRLDLAFPYAVRAAISLGLADLLTDGVDTLGELADRAGIQRRGLVKVVRLLSHEGLVTLSGDRVCLTTDGAFLVEDFARTRLDRASGIGRMDDAWPGLERTLRTGRPGFEKVTGTPFYDTLTTNERLGDSFDAAVADDSHTWIDLVVEHLKVIDEDVVDVGGGTGVLLDRILQSAPDAHGTLVDLPTSAERAREQLRSGGTLERARILPQSYFEPLPTGGGRYVLAHVLHDWPDAECAAILRRLAEVAGDAPVHVIERIPSEEDHGSDLEHDLRLYAVFGGGERTEDEHVALARDAGLRLVETAMLDEERCCLTFRANRDAEAQERPANA